MLMAEYLEELRGSCWEVIYSALCIEFLSMAGCANLVSHYQHLSMRKAFGGVECLLIARSVIVNT